VTAPVTAAAAARQLSAEALAVMKRFPPRPVPVSWNATAAGRFAVARRLLAPPFLVANVKSRYWRKLAMLKILDWLELHPGKTWQQRWNSSGADADGPATGGTRSWLTWLPPAGPAPRPETSIPGSARA
jgi:hypothetical protein